MGHAFRVPDRISKGDCAALGDAEQREAVELRGVDHQIDLAPHGVAFVSYNTYPGWRMRSMLRDAMIYHANQFADPAQRVQQARALLDFLAQNVPVENNPYGILLKNELSDLSKRGDWYIAHEHLEGVNEPVYFHEFAERASGRRKAEI